MHVCDHLLNDFDAMIVPLYVLVVCVVCILLAPLRSATYAPRIAKIAGRCAFATHTADDVYRLWRALSPRVTVYSELQPHGAERSATAAVTSASAADGASTDHRVTLADGAAIATDATPADGVAARVARVDGGGAAAGRAAAADGAAAVRAVRVNFLTVHPLGHGPDSAAHAAERAAATRLAQRACHVAVGGITVDREARVVCVRCASPAAAAPQQPSWLVLDTVQVRAPHRSRCAHTCSLINVRDSLCFPQLSLFLFDFANVPSNCVFKRCPCATRDRRPVAPRRPQVAGRRVTDGWSFHNGLPPTLRHFAPA